MAHPIVLDGSVNLSAWVRHGITPVLYIYLFFFLKKLHGCKYLIDVAIDHEHKLTHVELAAPHSVQESFLGVCIDVIDPVLVLVVVSLSKRSLQLCCQNFCDQLDAIFI